jgi:hypothetical protein
VPAQSSTHAPIEQCEPAIQVWFSQPASTHTFW